MSSTNSSPRMIQVPEDEYAEDFEGEDLEAITPIIPCSKGKKAPVDKTKEPSDVYSISKQVVGPNLCHNFFEALSEPAQLLYYNLRWETLTDGWYHGFDVWEFTKTHYPRATGKHKYTKMNEVLKLLAELVEKGWVWIDGTTIFLRGMIKHSTYASNVKHVMGFENKLGFLHGLLGQYIKYEIYDLNKRFGLAHRTISYYKRKEQAQAYIEVSLQHVESMRATVKALGKVANASDLYLDKGTYLRDGEEEPEEEGE